MGTVSIWGFMLVGVGGMLLGNAPRDPARIVAHVENLYRGRTSHAVARMEIRTEAWSRTLRLEIWAQGREKTRIVILDPPKERGVTTLQIGDVIWNYIPRLRRRIKITEGMLAESWMGSHFTYDDMVKEREVERLYRFRILREAGDTLVLEGVPREDAPVVWGRIVYTILQSRWIPLRIAYYDEEGELARVLEFSDPRKVKDRWIPFRMRLTPAGGEGYTEVVYEMLELDVPLPPRIFSPAALGR